jgi:response regulator RpfG family c-di-GMP phosphodiesterase
MRRALHISLTHHAVAAAIITTYGIYVCSFIDSLAPAIWLLTVMVILAVQAGGAILIRQALAGAGHCVDPQSAFKAELAAFVAGGAVLGAFNYVAHGFPVGSALKSALGFTTIGLFAAADQAIHWTHRRFAAGWSAPFTGIRWSLVARVGTAITIVMTLMIALSGLLIYRLIEDGAQADRKTSLLLAFELAFVLLVFVGYIVNLLRGIGELVRKGLTEQIETLQSAKTDPASRRARIATGDEIGLVATEINHLLDQLERAGADAARASDGIIRGLLSLASTRDNETGAHIRRTQAYVSLLVDDLIANAPEFGLARDAARHIVAAAPLHDIGKVAVPDAILRKPGRLDAAEFEVMKGHVAGGVAVIDSIIAEVGGTPFLTTARAIIAGHHEKYDGTGYPARLSGTDIPLAGRVMAVADVYDALRSARVYKPAMDRATARTIIETGAGTHFDPVVVSAFLRQEPAIDALARALADCEPVSTATVAEAA